MDPRSVLIDTRSDEITGTTLGASDLLTHAPSIGELNVTHQCHGAENSQPQSQRPASDPVRIAPGDAF